VPEGVLLDAAADRVDRVLAQLDRVERVQHHGGRGQSRAQRGVVAAERVQGRDLQTAGVGGVLDPDTVAEVASVTAASGITAAIPGPEAPPPSPGRTPGAHTAPARTGAPAAANTMEGGEWR